MTTRIIIPRDGIATGTQQPRAVYDSLSHQVLEAIGAVTTNRASHVDAGKDMCADALYLEITGKTPEELFPRLAEARTHA